MMLIFVNRLGCILVLDSDFEFEQLSPTTSDEEEQEPQSVRFDEVR